jgi:acyl-CoA thioesterase I
MNPIVLLFASGNVFFLGVVLTAIAAILRFRSSGRTAKLLQPILWLVGVSLAILSATPLPIWCYGIWLILSIDQQFAGGIQFFVRFRTKILILFVLFSAAMCFAELRYRLSPSIAVSQNQPVYVLGDSISAGIDDKERPWPTVLGDLSRLKITNLARPGATVGLALKQAENIHQSDALVVIEIGGNDLLGNTDSRTFYHQLDQLLAKLHQRDNQLVMFELPLFPFRNSLGRTQRILAKKYNVILIPKTYLTKVFGLKDATLDGLHLSQVGNDALANLVFKLLKPIR